ncbi:hypothetical protein L1887_57549 [Cichorium endivia]|nr:hypothetical protein L1887_57549 [Cichorium endivia]
MGWKWRRPVAPACCCGRTRIGFAVAEAVGLSPSPIFSRPESRSLTCSKNHLPVPTLIQPHILTLQVWREPHPESSGLVPDGLGAANDAPTHKDSGDVPVVTGEEPLFKDIGQRVVLLDEAARVARVSGRAPVRGGLHEKRIELLAGLERSDTAGHGAHLGATERGEIEESGNTQRALGEVDGGFGRHRRCRVLHGLRRLHLGEIRGGDRVRLPRLVLAGHRRAWIPAVHGRSSTERLLRLLSRLFARGWCGRGELLRLFPGLGLGLGSLEGKHLGHHTRFADGREHAETESSRDVGAETDLDAHVEHLAHARSARAQVEVAGGAVRHAALSLLDDGELVGIQMNRMRQDRARTEQRVVVVHRGVVLGKGEELLGERDLALVLAQMRLHT